MKEANRLNVLFATAEAAPFAKVGGLGDVAGALPQALNALGSPKFDVRVMLPFHAKVKAYHPEHRKIGAFDLTLLDGTALPCQIYLAQIGNTIVYLLDNEFINHNSPIYHGDWRLDGLKYVSFSLMVLEAAKYLDWKPDILHCNDWHTALAINALESHKKDDTFFKGIKTVLSIHNLPFNGWGSQEAMSLLGFKPYLDPDLPDWAKFTPLPMGIAASDLIIAVSPGYAKEITTHEFGCGIENYLKKHERKLIGILNGIDVESFNPKMDEAISYQFTADRLFDRGMNKLALQESLEFEKNQNIPLLTMVTRLSYQKGVDILLDALEELKDLPWQFVLLGTGEQALEEAAKNFALRFPEKFAAVIKYDENIARKLYASGDIFTMPSRYEPCGLSQMIAMRYGNLPVANATGGLNDSIVDYNDQPSLATGFLNKGMNLEGFTQTLRMAMELYKNKAAWTQLQRNAMAKDFSWHNSAYAYAMAYQSLLVE